MNDTTIATSDDELERLAVQIAAAHEAAAGGSLERARDAGQLLLAAKDRCEFGSWLSWLDANCPGIGARQTQKYMRLAARWHELAGANANPDSHLSIEDALRRLSDAPPEEPPGLDAPPASVPTESHESPEPEPARMSAARTPPVPVVSRPAPGSMAPGPTLAPKLPTLWGRLKVVRDMARPLTGRQALGPGVRAARIALLESAAWELLEAADRLRHRV